MKQIIFFTAVFFFTAVQIPAQSVFKKASINEDATISVEEILMDTPLSMETAVESEPFLIFGRPAFAIKNQRGLALADLDGDGVEEMIFGMDHTLYAVKGDGSILFERTFSGPVLWPPAIADMDGSGNLKIAVNYGYPAATTPGGVTLLDTEGNDLPGWPQSFDGHWMIESPSMGDLDGDGVMEIVTGERVSGSVGLVHAIKMDGSPLSENWPVQITSTPSFTPSIGDVNNDGIVDVVIAGSSTGMYIFDANGNLHDGFPVEYDGVGYSYQSPILVDLNGDGNLEIVGSNHGDAPAIYVMKADGTYMDGWPHALPSWTYSPPAVADVNGDGIYDIFAGFPFSSFDGSEGEVMFGLQPDGSDMPGFPIQKEGGNEGVITIGDINNDGIPDLIFGSNMTDENMYGYIHAYSTDGSGQLDGFPLRPRGFTFMNGAVLGDVDNDGVMDLTAFSYTNHFGADVDSIFVSSYSLDVPYDPAKIIRNGYKGDNTRSGLLSGGGMNIKEIEVNSIKIYPNPSNGELNIRFEKQPKEISVSVFDLTGRRVFFEQKTKAKLESRYEFEQLPKGVYIIYVTADEQKSAIKWIKK